MFRPRMMATAVALVTGVVLFALPVDAHTATGTRTAAKLTAAKVQSAAKAKAPTTTKKAKVKSTVKSTTSKKPRKSVPTTTRRKVTTPNRVTTTRAAATSTLPAVVEGVDVGNPGANIIVPTTPVAVVPAVSTAPSSVPSGLALPATTTTLAPFPAPANLPTRASAATVVPYYGLGTWVDAFDWTVQKGGRVPKVNSQTVDAMAAVGVQTLFIQAARYDSADVAEPERLIPIINRAHELGLYVVVWYLPTFTDVNADLRRTVAIANLDVDGISIDIEARNVTDVAERNRRLVAYSQALRTLLPGRFISNNIVQPNILEAVPNLWPTEFGKPPATPTS